MAERTIDFEPEIVVTVRQGQCVGFYRSGKHPPVQNLSGACCSRSAPSGSIDRRSRPTLATFSMLTLCVGLAGTTPAVIPAR